MKNLIENRRDFLKKMMTATVFTAIIPHKMLGKVEPIVFESLNNSIIKYPVSLTQYPDLRKLWISVDVIFKDPKGLYFHLFIIHIDKHKYGSEFAAIDPKCTHQGCTIGQYIKQYGMYTCPCQGSEFDVVGTFIKGWAYDKYGNGINLTRYDTEYKDGDDIVYVLWRNPYPNK